jgi:hypothetical protein
MHELWLILHFFGMALVIGSSTSMFLILLLNQNQPIDEKKVLMESLKRAMKLVGPTGLALLIVSGVFLSVPMWAFLKTSALFHIKVTLVFVLVLLLIFNRVKQSKSNGKDGPKTAPFPLPMLISIVVMILAVLIFE